MRRLRFTRAGDRIRIRIAVCGSAVVLGMATWPYVWMR